MKIALHITDQILWTWPPEYWSELIKMLINDEHELYVYTDEKHLRLQFSSSKIKTFIAKTQNEYEESMKECSVFVGSPLKFSKIADKCELKVINFLGATSCGIGVRSLMPCVGCLDQNKTIDCQYHDELCMTGITPFMVKREIDNYIYSTYKVVDPKCLR